MTSHKILAQMLRRRLEGHVSAHVLNTLTDEELVQQYHEHHASKLQAIREKRQAAAD